MKASNLWGSRERERERESYNLRKKEGMEKGLSKKNRPLFICTTKITKGINEKGNAKIQNYNILKMQKDGMKNILNAVPGITLIALVVTIVVLLILASISITVIFGKNGLIQMAKEAKNATSNAIDNDLEGMKGLSDIIGDFLNKAPKTIEEAVRKHYKFEQDSSLIDKYGNSVTIPAGFTIVPHGTDNVEYNYDKNESGESTHIPTVQDGIVIKDKENYFVWVPVGSQIKNRKD